MIKETPRQIAGFRKMSEMRVIKLQKLRKNARVTSGAKFQTEKKESSQHWKRCTTRKYCDRVRDFSAARTL
jgi:hypothetical protein